MIKVTITQHCYSLTGAKIAAKCFRKVSPKVRIHIRRGNTVHIVLHGSERDAQPLVYFSLCVGKAMYERSKEKGGNNEKND